MQGTLQKKSSEGSDSGIFACDSIQNQENKV